MSVRPVRCEPPEEGHPSMSVWTITRTTDAVKLTFTHDPLAENPFIQPCGHAELALECDVEAFVFDQADPWDLIHTPRGTFVRQRPGSRDLIRPAEAPVEYPEGAEAAA